MKKLFWSLLLVLSIVACTTNEDVLKTPQQTIDLNQEEDLMLPPEFYNEPLNLGLRQKLLDKNVQYAAKGKPQPTCEETLVKWEQTHGINGTNANIPIVFVAEGFICEDMGEFDTYVQSIVNYWNASGFLQGYTFPSGQTMGFDIYSYRTVSNESGIDDIINNVTVDSYWNAGIGFNNTARLVALPNANQAQLWYEITRWNYNSPSQTSKLPWVEYIQSKALIVMVCNEPNYGGGGYYPSEIPSNYSYSLCLTTTDAEHNHAWLEELATHELLHGLYLDDAYVDLAYDPYDTWCDHLNVTQDTITNPIYGGGPYFLGAKYDNTHWRNRNDIMRSLSYPVSDVVDYAAQEYLRCIIAGVGNGGCTNDFCRTY